MLPILHLGLESPTHSIVDKSLGCLPTILAILDFSTIKNELFPVVAAVFSKTSSLGIKIRGLEAFVTLCGGSVDESNGSGDGLDGTAAGSQPSKLSSSAILDKYTVQEKIVPLLKAIKTKEPAVMMAALAVFRQVGKIADAEFLAIEVLPLLWSFSLGPLLNLKQFQEYMGLIKHLSSKIEQEQSRKLRELSSNSNGTSDISRSNDLMTAGGVNGVSLLNEPGDMGANDFERLVLGKSMVKESNGLGESLRPAPQQAQTPVRTDSSIFSWSTPALTPNPNPNFRTITPDQTFNSFTSFKPSSAGSSIPNTTLNQFPPLAPMQRPTTPAQPWSFSSAPLATPTIQQRPSPQIQFPPPPQAPQNPFSNFAIAPPPSYPQRSNVQAKSGGGLGVNAGSGTIAQQQAMMLSMPQQKKGLDAYESLL